MALRVSGKNLAIGEALRGHVTERVDAAYAKYAAGQVLGHVTIEPEGSGFRTDCTLHLPSGTTLQVEGQAQEPYASVNLAVDRFERRLRRYRRRLRDHHGVAVTNGQASTLVQAADGPADDDEIELVDGAPGPAVIAERCREMKRMSVSRAALQLDETNANVVVFGSAGDGRPNIVYRRADGNIGWIDTAALTN
jgi:ribosomal subunit interface protein